VTVPTSGCFALPNGVIASNCRYALQPLITAKSAPRVRSL
jgi:hypothetical protein